MRIIRFISEDGRTLHGEAASDGLAIILAGSIAQGFERTTQRARIKKLLAPLEPRDIICIGRNYHDRPLQKREAASDERPESFGPGHGAQREEDAGRVRNRIEEATLEVFLKPSFALQHPNDPILIPNFPGINPQLDCEGELAIVIGRLAQNIHEENALDHVFGYTIANDVTARHFQTKTGPPLWMRGKGFPTFCPLGPAIVTADTVSDPQSLSIRTLINNQVVRDGNTRDMIRNARQIIAALSRHLPLQPGTLILTGAPPLVAQGIPLHEDDLATIEIAGIGALSNRVTSDPREFIA